MNDTEIEKAKHICKKLLEGSLSFDELHKLWPEPSRDNPWFDIWNDFEFAIEHTPGYWKKPGIDPKKWRQMPEYEMITRYLEELNSGKIPDSDWPSKSNES